MEFTKLTLVNFKSFKGTHGFTFHGPGLYFITGTNKSEPSLQGNGIGKSTLFDALCFVLYGKTTRNLRASNVHTWRTRGQTGVELDFIAHGGPHHLQRCWGPNALKLDGEDVSQQELEAFIGINQDAFQHSILISQFGRMFFDLEPAEKLSLFTDILGLNYWVERSSMAQGDMDTALSEIRRMGELKSNVEGTIGALKTVVAREKTMAKEFEQEKGASIKEYQNTIKRLKDDLQAYEKQITSCDDINGVKDEILGLEEVLSEIRGESKQVENDWFATDKECAQIASKIDTIEIEYNKFVDVINSDEKICPYCKQTVSVNHLNHETKTLKDKMHVLITGFKEKSESRSSLKDYLTELSKEATTVNNQIVAETKRAESVERSIRSANSNIDRIKDKIELHKQSIAELNASVNKHEASVSEISTTIANRQLDLAGIQEGIDGQNQIAEMAKHWVKAFKDIRLSIVDQVITELEIAVNNNVQQLGLDGWTIKFDVEKETKSGAVTKGFTVLVQSPYNDDTVPWKAWSGGEGQRLRLAGTLGLASTILASRGVSANIMVLDEPTQHTSPQGVEELIELLHEKAQQDNKTIYFIDHHSYDSGLFDGVVEITKGNDGSQFVIN